MSYKLLIGGSSVPGDRGTYPIVNPATEQVVGEAPEASVEQVEAAAEAAAAALSRLEPHDARRARRAAEQGGRRAP